MAASPLVSVQWLHEHMHASPTGLVILDASYPMPGEKRDVAKDFEVARIRGAQLFGIKNCSDKSSPHPNMLPGADEFSAFVKNFGIGRNSHVVVYDNNSKFGIFSAPRVWWTFRVFGHSRVSVLDGGLPEWIAKGFPTDNGPPQSDPVKSGRKRRYAMTYKHWGGVVAHWRGEGAFSCHAAVKKLFSVWGVSLLWTLMRGLLGAPWCLVGLVGAGANISTGIWVPVSAT